MMYFKYLLSPINNFKHEHTHTRTRIQTHTEGLHEWTHLEIISGAVLPVWPEPRGPLGFGSSPALPERPCRERREAGGGPVILGSYEVQITCPGSQLCECLVLSGCPFSAKYPARQGHLPRHVQ